MSYSNGTSLSVCRSFTLKAESCRIGIFYASISLAGAFGGNLYSWWRVSVIYLLFVHRAPCLCHPKNGWHRRTCRLAVDIHSRRNCNGFRCIDLNTSFTRRPIFCSVFHRGGESILTSANGTHNVKSHSDFSVSLQDSLLWLSCLLSPITWTCTKDQSRQQRRWERRWDHRQVSSVRLWRRREVWVGRSSQR